jgi:hypothetical protein
VRSIQRKRLPPGCFSSQPDCGRLLLPPVAGRPLDCWEHPSSAPGARSPRPVSLRAMERVPAVTRPPKSGDPRRSPRACGSQNRSIVYQCLTIRHRLPRMKPPYRDPKPKHSGLATIARGSKISACPTQLSRADWQARARPPEVAGPCIPARTRSSRSSPGAITRRSLRLSPGTVASRLLRARPRTTAAVAPTLPSRPSSPLAALPQGLPQLESSPHKQRHSP